MMAEPVAEEAEPVHAAALGLFLVLMHGKARHHGNVRVHIIADGHAFFLEDAVIVVDPFFRLFGIDESKSESPDA